MPAVLRLVVGVGRECVGDAVPDGEDLALRLVHYDAGIGVAVTGMDVQWVIHRWMSNLETPGVYF